MCIAEVALQNYTLISYQTKVVCISYVIVDIKKTRKGNGGQQGRKTRVGSVKHKRNATEAEHDRRGNQKKGKEDLS